MCQDLPPLTSWEFFLFCRKVLGISFLQKVFQRGHSEIYRWSRDPEFTADSKRNPLDRLRLLLKEMRNQGHEREARAEGQLSRRGSGVPNHGDRAPRAGQGQSLGRVPG